MIFADNLVRLRREKGFSQEQLADLMDVSRQAVSKWEAGAATYLKTQAEHSTRLSEISSVISMV